MDVDLWDTFTNAIWGSLDFCLVVMQFKCLQSCKQLTTLSQAGAWGNVEKSLTGYGVHLDSAKPSHWVWAGLQLNSHVGTFPPGLPSHSQGSSPEADVIGQKKAPTGHMPMCGCMMPWHMCLCLVRDTLGSWLMVCPVQMPTVTWNNCRCGSCCNVGVR